MIIIIIMLGNTVYLSLSKKKIRERESKPSKLAPERQLQNPSILLLDHVGHLFPKLPHSPIWLLGLQPSHVHARQQHRGKKDKRKEIISGRFPQGVMESTEDTSVYKLLPDLSHKSTPSFKGGCRT